MREPVRKLVCVNFNGVQHSACAAGIAYKSVEGMKPGHHTLPCFRTPERTECPSSCASYTEPTVEQLAEFNAKLDARFDEITQRQSRGECRDCGAKVVSVSQSGRCVYAEPCGHRIGQGDAKQVAKSYGVNVTARR